MKRLEVLRHKVVFSLHIVHLEVDQAGVRENNKSLLPVAEESLALLPERSHFTDRHEVVSDNLTPVGRVSLHHFLLEALVAHDELLLVDGLSSNHRVSQGILIGDIVIVNLLTVAHLLERLQRSQVVIDASSLHGLLLELLASLLLLQPPLDLLLDQERLPVRRCDQFGPFGLKLFLFVVVVLLLELKLRSLHVEELPVGDQGQSLNLNIVPDLINVSLSSTIALANHVADLIITGLGSWASLGIPRTQSGQHPHEIPKQETFIRHVEALSRPKYLHLGIFAKFHRNLLSAQRRERLLDKF